MKSTKRPESRRIPGVAFNFCVISLTASPKSNGTEMSFCFFSIFKRCPGIRNGERTNELENKLKFCVACTEHYVGHTFHRNNGFLLQKRRCCFSSLIVYFQLHSRVAQTNSGRVVVARQRILQRRTCNSHRA